VPVADGLDIPVTLRQIHKSRIYLATGTMKVQSIALNRSDALCSNPASTAVHTAAKYSLSLCPFCPANSVNNMYHEPVTTFAKSKTCRMLLNKGKE
jgi:hypothetical protein